MIEQIETDLRAARIARDGEAVSTLSMLLAAMKSAAKDAGGELDDQAALAILRRERKRREEAAASFREGGREEQAAKEEAEAATIARYMPAELAPEEVASLVDAAIAETGATTMRDMGGVVKAVMAASQGRADGKAVSTLVKERLAG